MDTMDNILAERAQQLFLLADKERKGFIVKRDMQHMRSEVPLSPDQLETVFDSLDVQGNRYLTLHQFLSGFGEYLSLEQRASHKAAEDGVYSSDGDQDTSLPLRRQLDEVLAHLKHEDFFGSLQQLCARVQTEGSCESLEALLVFLHQLWHHVSRRTAEVAVLHQTCRDKEELHRTEMLRLYEDLDKQMKDKRPLSSKEQCEASVLAATLSQELQRREKQLAEIQEEHQQMAARVYELKATVAAVKLDNDKLMASKMELECDLQRSCDQYCRLQRCLESARMESSRDRQKYTSHGFQLARSILVEQQGLRRQLHLLESISASLETGADGHQQDARNSSAAQDCCGQCAGAAEDLACLDYEYDEDFHKSKCEQLGEDAVSSKVSTAAVKTATPCLQEEMLNLLAPGSPRASHVVSGGLHTRSTTPDNTHST